MQLRNFRTRTSEQLLEILERNKVVLNNVKFYYSYLRGTVLVKNISFEKRILIRFTFDEWKTVNEVEARYGSIKLSGHDSFIFDIDLDLEGRLPNLQFAISYDARGESYWDNNNNKNYSMRFVVNHTPEKITFPQPLKSCQKVKLVRVKDAAMRNQDSSLQNQEVIETPKRPQSPRSSSQERTYPEMVYLRTSQSFSHNPWGPSICQVSTT